MQTITVHESGGEVMVPFGTPGTFIRGKRTCVRITSVGPDPDTPQGVKEALVGVSFDIVLTRQQVIAQCGKAFEEVLPEGCLLAYVAEVIQALQAYDRYAAAADLKKIASDEFDMYVLEKDTFQIID